jgi:hypothetical protein
MKSISSNLNFVCLQKNALLNECVLYDLLNFLMLYTGYLGETKVLSTWTASFAGFIPFTIMFYLIYVYFVKPTYNIANYVLFGVYVTVWSLYGVVYLLKEEYKNIFMNILDCVAKCLIGLGLWAYYSRIIVL